MRIEDAVLVLTHTLQEHGCEPPQKIIVDRHTMNGIRYHVKGAGLVYNAEANEGWVEVCGVKFALR